ncbi:MAG: ACP S-malonyltransferase [Firmicutes bacterium]|nr:ACP S-malonyltransferase [Bacillota bacterium]
MKDVAEAVAFPGQGVQAVGMEKSIRGTPAWELFAEASDLLGYDLARIIAEGPEDRLNQTDCAQPAVFVVCCALWRLCSARHRPLLFLGHSLGEVTALAAAGAFSFAEGLKLVAKRGELMAKQKGGMLAVLGLTVETVEQICTHIQKDHWVQVANINSPGQVVVSGEIPGLAQVEEQAKAHGARRVVPLRVSGPFHSHLMAPAAAALQDYINLLEIKDIEVPVMSNHTSELLSSAAQIKAELSAQLVSPVRFTDNILKAAQLGVDTLVEVGSAPLVGPMAKRTVSTLKIILASPGGM